MTTMRRNSSHARSKSLPSISHPTVSKAEELLCRLRSSEAVRSSPPASSSSIRHDLVHLNSLYECVEDLLQLPFTLTGQDKSSKWVDQMLDESLMLLDVCGTTRDVLLEVKESVQDLESSFRRRKWGESLVTELAAYKSSRKTVNKVISKCLGDLKRIENHNNNSSALSEEEPEVTSIIRQVEAITHSIFESILLSLSIGSSKSRSSTIRGWLLVSKMMHTKSFTGQEKVTGVGEIEKVEVALKRFPCKETDIREVQKQLVGLEISIQGFEDGLECVFRHLMIHRVSLLNILSY